MEHVDFTILAATSVLGDMIDKCPPAETCRDAFDRMSKATVQMCMSTTGFGSSGEGLDTHSIQPKEDPDRADHPVPSSRPKHNFDMSLSDLLNTSPHPPSGRPSIKSESSHNDSHPFHQLQNHSQPIPSQDPEILSYPASTTAGGGAGYQDFTYALPSDTDLGFLSGWEQDMHDGFGHGLVWESVDHDFSEGERGGLPDPFGGFYFGGPGNL
jgi:hypothetical protein